MKTRIYAAPAVKGLRLSACSGKGVYVMLWCTLLSVCRQRICLNVYNNIFSLYMNHVGEQVSSSIKNGEKLETPGGYCV